VFYFVLPPPVTDDDEADASDASDAEAHAASVSTLSSAEEDTETPAETQPKLVLKPRSRLETAKGKKRSHEPEALSNAAASDETKRQRTVDAAPVQPGASRSPPVDAEARSGGKGKGKSAKTKVEADDTLADDAAPLSALANAATHATGPVFQKPDLSNVQLITNALSSESCARKGSKLTLQEVYEWLQNTYPWFSQNGRKTGRDWQSSIRHTIGTCREFVKIPRRPDEPGKGIFYTLSTSELAKAQEAARHEAPSAVHDTPAAPLPAATHSSTPASASTAAAAAATAATPKSAGTTKVMPRIPLVVGVPPNADAVVPRSKGAPGSIESLLDTPPIAHHQGRLYLSPTVFGHLKPEQLSQIEALGAQQALQVLQSYLVTHLKERMKKTSAAPTATTTASPAAMKPMPSAPPATTPAATPPAASSAASAPRPGVYDQRLEAPKVPRIPVATTPSQPAPLPSASPSVAKSSVDARAPTPPTPAPAMPAVAHAQPARTAAGSSAPRPASIPSVAPGGSSSPAAGPDSSTKSDDPLSALSVLAAHPEAAGLIALLKQQQAGGSGTVKLTPGQLELLQLANRLALQKKKKKEAPSEPRPSS